MNYAIIERKFRKKLEKENTIFGDVTLWNKIRISSKKINVFKKTLGQNQYFLEEK